MTILRNHGWRLLLVASAITLAVGGSQHPESDAGDPLRQELATMTSDDRWVPAHAWIVLSTILLALALWIAHRQRVWPTSVRRPLLIAAVAVSLYVVETVAHLGAVLDSDALADGHAAPIAFGHIGLASVLYPVTGWAIVYLAFAFGRAWSGWRRLVSATGVVAGLLHAFSVPLTIMFPDAELSPVFATAAISIAIFSLGTGIAGAPRPVAAPASTPEPERVG